MPDPNVRVRHSLLSGGGQQVPGGDLVVHTPVSTVFGFIGITGAVLCPWTMSIQLS